LTTALVVGAEVSAHRTDEYLQAARLAIEPTGVEIELDLTPGIAFAETILAAIDRNHDGSLSPDEQRVYGSSVVSALQLEVDGRRLPLELAVSSFPDPDAIRRGEGTIRIHSTGTLRRLTVGVHQLLFRNGHHPDGSVYLANALVPASDWVAVTAQRRDGEQRELMIDFVTRPRAATWTPVWLFGSIAGAAGLAGLLRRRSQRLCVDATRNVVAHRG
jgi:hypothetical protein